MKRSILGMLVLAATFTFGARAAEGFDDLVKLVKAGVGEDVLIAYIEASNQNFEMNVDDILYLNDIGAPAKVVTAAVRKGGLQNAPLPEGPAPVDPAAPVVAEANDPNGPLIAPRTVSVNETAPKAHTPAVLPPAVPEDYDRTVREIVGQTPATPGAGYPNGPAVDPVVGRPEPIRVEQAVPAREIQPAQPAYTQKEQIEHFDDDTQQPQIIEREVVREVVVEKPVYISTNTVVAPPDDQLNVSFFYESLSPYGSWMSIDNEYYWQPSVVVTNSSWRPYWDNGSWVYTDYGWTWNSSYSWGWAPFHYGRWNCHPRHGWVWRPDTTWGPAWVHWRSNNDYCGWAPLPGDCGWDAGIGFSYRGKHVGLDFHFGLGERDYCFVPYNRFYERDVYRYGARNVYNNTVIVNNYYDYRDRRLVNNGPGYDSVRRGWGRDIKPVRITDAGYRSGDTIRPARLRDDSLAVYRPNIRRETPETPQAVIARREREQQRIQAERQAQRDRQRTVQATPGRDNRQDARQDARQNARQDTRQVQTVTNDRRAEADAQRQREVQARREAESRAQAERQANTQRERVERETREDQRKAQEQTRTVAREDERRAEQARREAQRVQEETRRTVQNQARQQEEQQQQARQQQLEAQRRAEQTQREQQRLAERQAEQNAREQAQREQQTRQAQLEQQRRAERAEQAQRDAQREAQRDAQLQAERQAAQQQRLEAQREQQLRQQQMQAQRQAEQQARETQREAQRQQIQQREPVQREPRQQVQQREQIQRVPQQRYEPSSRDSMGGRQSPAMTEREAMRRGRD